MTSPGAGLHPLTVWREKHGVSPDSLAERLGVARYTIFRYENGRVPVPPVLNHIVLITEGEVTANDWLSPAATKAILKNLERHRVRA